MRTIAELSKRLEHAQEQYTRACTAIDGELKGIIRMDPGQLGEAKALQADYLVEPTAVELAAAEQPSDAPADAGDTPEPEAPAAKARTPRKRT